MAGKIIISNPSGGTPGGNDKELQYNNSGSFAGCAQLFWDNANDRLGLGDSTPAKQLSLTKCMEMLVCSGSGVGVIYKGANRFLHDFKHATANGNNLFIGANCGNFTMSPGGGAADLASNNVGLGVDALKALTDGKDNMAIGYRALTAATGGSRNVAIGKESLDDITGGWYNIGIGCQSLFHDVVGDSNIAIGYGAGRGTDTQSFSDNILIGYKAGYILGTGADKNICIGSQAGDNITTGHTNITIGYGLDALAAAGNYQLNIAGAIFGTLGGTKRVGVNTSTMNETLNVGGAIRLGTSALTNAGTIRWTGTNFEGYSTRWRTLNNDDNAAVYTVWKSGSTYYAKASVISGLTDYSGNAFHTVLQSALDATDNAGGIINFAPGTYSVTGKITGRSDVILQGCGQNWGSKGTIFSLDADVDMFEFGVTECFEFKHILFDGNDRNQVTLYFHGTADNTPCQNFHITKCGFKDCRRAVAGIYAYDCYITDTGFTSCGHFASSFYACYANTGCNAWHFKDCRWETLKGHAFYSGVSGNHEFHFIGCKFHGWTPNQYHAIAGYMSFGSIVGCFFYDMGASYRAIYSQGDGLCVTGNVFENCKGYAIEIVAGADKNSITGNTFYTVTDITAHISNAGADTVITGNTVYEANNDLIVHTDSTAIRSLNCAAFSNLVVRDDDVEAMADQAYWTPSPGLYNISCWGPELQLWVNGAWYVCNVGICGMVYCDGTNQRLFNNAGALQNVYWQRF